MKPKIRPPSILFKLFGGAEQRDGGSTATPDDSDTDGSQIRLQLLQMPPYLYH